MGVMIELTIEQVAHGLKRLTPEELADLELLLDQEEIDQRSREVKSGSYLRVEDLNSLRDV
jgi:hypothetical protein